MKVSVFENCYDDSWAGLIVPEAFSHPAKFAPGLIRRIYQHCLERGYLRKGDTVVDPFAGIGGGGIFAAVMGLKWRGVELEERFCVLGQEDFKLHYRDWIVMGYPLPAIIQGDSRFLSRVIDSCDALVTSSPYGNSAVSSNGQRGIDSRDTDTTKEKRKRQRGSSPDRYSSQTPGQIGNLKSGDLGAVVDCITTSPPFEQSLAHKEKDGTLAASGLNEDGSRRGGSLVGTSYGNSDGQIGQESSENYWAACAQVYRECHKILKPGGVIIIVVKAYVKGGKRVPLPMQTLKLLIYLGFTPLERIKAMLIKETVTPGLFGEIKKVKARKSFFRRLAESKGSPAINWEEVLICRK